MIVQIDPSNFYSSVNALASISGSSVETALKVQVSKVLSACIRYTPEASDAEIIKSVAYRNSRIDIPGGEKLTINVQPGSGNRGWLIDESTWEKCNWGKGNKSNVQGSTQPARKNFQGRTLHAIGANRRWGNARWSKYQAMFALLHEHQLDQKAALKSKGLTKLSWYQIALSLTMEISGVPKRILSANTFKGFRAPDMGSGTSAINESGAIVTIFNNSKILTRGRALNGWGILQRAMDARLSAFQKELKQGVFDDALKRAKRYPGIF